ncbi:MAG: translation elongation factor Ts [Oscillospiraceae bacterium]|jgi:elongation factor Ts
MGFTAKDVQNLRAMTGVGMMDCKKALAASDGDIDKAIEFLREKGLAAAQKKASRIAAEGIVTAIVENGVGAIVEVNSETDFVAKNEVFRSFVLDVAKVVAAQNPADLDTLMEMNYPGTDMTITQALQEKILVIGENLKVRRFARYSEGINVAYIHGGGRIGVLVNLKVSDNIKDDSAIQELGKDIAMQAASMRPLYLDSSVVPAEELKKEEEIQYTKAIEENKARNMDEAKAAQIAKNMVKGRINKYFEEVCLLNQPFIKENKISVGQHVANTAKELGGEIAVTGFVRFEKGEGLEKRVDNFADEVASLTK